LHPLKSELVSLRRQQASAFARVLTAGSRLSRQNFPIGEKKDLDYTKEGERWRLPIAALDFLLYASAVALSGKVVRHGRLLSQACEFTDSAGTIKMPERLLHAGTLDDSRRLLEQLVCAIDFGFAEKALAREPHVVLLREEFYHESQGGHDSLKILLSRLILKFMRSFGIATPSEERPNAMGGVQSSSPGLSDDEILAYVMQRPLPTDDLGRKCALVKPHDRQMLNLAHDFIGVYLPHALRKIDRCVAQS
jgi:hypothetical protein